MDLPDFEITYSKRPSERLDMETNQRLMGEWNFPHRAAPIRPARIVPDASLRKT
jgi:hypothetical protein